MFLGWHLWHLWNSQGHWVSWKKKHRMDHTTPLGVRQGCWLSYVVFVVLNYGTTPAFMANMVECRIWHDFNRSWVKMGSGSLFFLWFPFHQNLPEIPWTMAIMTVDHEKMLASQASYAGALGTTFSGAISPETAGNPQWGGRNEEGLFRSFQRHASTTAKPGFIPRHPKTTVDDGCQLLDPQSLLQKLMWNIQSWRSHTIPWTTWLSWLYSPLLQNQPIMNVSMTFPNG